MRPLRRRFGRRRYCPYCAKWTRVRLSQEQHEQHLRVHWDLEQTILFRRLEKGIPT